MNILFLDTEQNKFLDYKTYINDDIHLLQSSFILTDKYGNIKNMNSCLINPNEKWDIYEDMFDVHGISYLEAKKYGINIKDYLRYLSFFLEKSDYIVGHNIKYDLKILNKEYKDNLSIDLKTKYSFKIICTMKVAQNNMKISTSFGDYKLPSLIECCKHYLNLNFEQNHNSLEDTYMTKDIFFEMLRRKEIILGRKF